MSHATAVGDNADSITVVDLSVSTSDADRLCDMLWAFGVAGIEEREATVELACFRTSIGSDPIPTLDILTQALPEMSWQVHQIDRKIVDTWREFAEVTMVNDHVVFVPAWMSAASAETAIFIEPFDTFGLGNHPTTVLAARLCASRADRASRILDLGCGSGVLAIMIAKLGGGSVDAFDIDPGSQSAVTFNAHLNSLSPDRIRWTDALRESPTGHYDLVVANILAPVLRAQAASIRRVTCKNGVVVLSGVRENQLSDVVSHFEPCEIEASDSMDGWVAVALSLQS